MSKRSIIYVDGLNLYYGAVRGTPYKWLNIERMFERLRQHDDIQAVKYFTAEIAGDRRGNQLAYLNALATCPRVEVIQGKFKWRNVKCQVQRCSFDGSRWFRVPEEKRTDVNIATALLDDAFDDLADRFVVVSGDSDLVPALNRMKARFPEKQLIVYVPARDATRGAATELRGAADKSKTLPQALLRVSQFPAQLDDGRGGMIEKPAEW